MFADNVSLCSLNDTFSFWNDSWDDFGICFQELAIISPLQCLLAISCLVQIIRKSRLQNYGDDRNSSWLKYACVSIRLLSVLGLLIVSIIQICTINNSELSASYLTLLITAIICWTSNGFYIGFKVLNNKNQLHFNHRGSKFITIVWILLAIGLGLHCRSIFIQRKDEIFLYYYYATAIFIGIFLTSLLLPKNYRNDTNGHIFLVNEGENGNNINSNELELGVAKRFTPWLSKVFFYWVNPLIKKGRLSLLNHTDDLFDVPNDIQPKVAGANFQIFAGFTNSSLLKVLFKAYGKEFFLVGLLKFLSDMASFAGPMLLNLLVSFMENNEKTNDYSSSKWGYLYALGLTGATFAAALCDTHFNMFMGELKLKVRSAIVTRVYQHSVQRTENKGKIINIIHFRFIC